MKIPSEIPNGASSMTFGHQVLRGVAWTTLFGYVIAITSFVGNIVLARILLPRDFGDFALAFSTLVFVFMLSGFGSQEAITQCRDDSIQHLIPTAAWISLGIGIGLGLIGTVLGIVLLSFVEDTVAHMVIVLSWLRLASLITGVDEAILKRNLSFKPIVMARGASTLLSFLIGGGAALAGFGPWALVVRVGSESIIAMILMNRASHFRPTYHFNWKAAGWIWSFGWRMMVTRITEETFGNLDNLMVGTVLGTQQLGYYALSYRLSYVGFQFLGGPIHSVLFSAFSAVQKSTKRLNYAFERSNFWLLRGVILLGLMTALGGKEAVIVVYTSKWEQAGIVFENMFFFLAWFPVHESFKSFLIGAGHVKMVVRSRIILLGFFIPMVIIAAYWGDLVKVAWVVNASILLAWALLAYHTNRIVTVRWRYLMLSPIIAAGFALACGEAVFRIIEARLLVKTSIQLFTAGTAYSIALLFFEHRALRSEWQIIRTRMAK